MKKFARFTTLVLTLRLYACSGIPITSSYEGSAMGHNVIVGYSGKNGVAVAISQK